MQRLLPRNRLQHVPQRHVQIRLNCLFVNPRRNRNAQRHERLVIQRVITHIPTMAQPHARLRNRVVYDPPFRDLVHPFLARVVCYCAAGLE